MPVFTPKELYIMNGGNKLYIYMDGFADVYEATPAEEAVWAKEIIANKLDIIEHEENAVTLEFAIKCLQFHEYVGLKALVLDKMKDASPARKSIFTAALAHSPNMK
jgi:hypothetical protein